MLRSRGCNAYNGRLYNNKILIKDTQNFCLSLVADLILAEAAKSDKMKSHGVCRDLMRIGPSSEERS